MVDDGWDNYTRGAGSLDPLVRGRPVVFKDGEYFVDDKPLPPGGQYVVLRLIERWTKRPQGQPPEHVVAGPGERRLERKELGDNNDKLWKFSKYNTSERIDPWKDGRNVWLMNVATHELLTFQTESRGGRLGVEELGDQIAEERAKNPSAVAVVELLTADYGATTRPRLAVVEFLPSAPAVQLEPLKLPQRKLPPPIDDDRGGGGSPPPIDDDIQF